MTGTVKARHSVPRTTARSIDWARAEHELDAQGWTVVPAFLTAKACDRSAALYEECDRFRSKVIMSRHGFGRGEYQYFRYPLPPLVAGLRSELYPFLVPIANRWHERMRLPVRFPADHESYLRLCHEAGQVKPTPLILNYSAGDYNCLHQDLYGDHVFPLQIAILLSEPGSDFSGGEFVMTEQRPRMQSRPHVVPLRKGDAVIFAVSTRPVAGKRGDYRVTMRHGVSRIFAGSRKTLGIIFHDAG